MNQKHLQLLFASFLFYVSASAQTMVPDSSFGNNGITKIDPLGYESVYTNSVVVQNNKPLFAVTGTFDEYGVEGRVRRLTRNGLPDKSFADKGILDTKSSYSAFVNRLVLQPDNKLLTLTRESPHYDHPIDTVWLERFLLDGSADASFGTHGAVYIHKEYAIMSAKNLVLKPDGNIIVEFAADGKQFIAQFSSAGEIDTHFGLNGRILSQSRYDGNISDLAALPNKKLLAADVYRKVDNTYGSCLIRYSAKGKIDSTFGVNGVLENNNTITNTIRSLDITLQPDGKVLLYTEDNGNDVLLRYKIDATLDSSFGTNGKVTIGTTIGNGYAAAAATSMQANSRIIVKLTTGNQLKRFLPDGTTDLTFGTNGILDVSSIVREGLSFISFENRLLIAGGMTNTTGYKDIVMVVYKPCIACASMDAVTNTLYTQKIALPDAKPSIRFYPNPVTNLLTIQGLNSNAKNTLLLANASGKIVKSITTHNDTYQWNVQQLPAGIYYVRIIQDKDVYASFKIVKE